MEGTSRILGAVLPAPENGTFEMIRSELLSKEF
jgi:hypothetical protein